MQGPIVLYGPVEAKDVGVLRSNPPRPGVPTEAWETFWQYKRWSYGRVVKNTFNRNKAMVYLWWNASRHTPRLRYSDTPWGESTCVQCDTKWPCPPLLNSGFDFTPGQFVVAAFQSMSYIGAYRRLGRLLYPHGAFRQLVVRHDQYRHDHYSGPSGFLTGMAHRW